MRRAWFIPLLLLTMCHKSDPIAETIQNAVKAAEERDAEAVAAQMTANYSDPNGGRREAEETLSRYFFGYRSIDVNIRDLKTFVNGPTAQARFAADFSGVAKQIGGLDQILPSSASYRFEVWLAQEDGKWKITAAQWHQEPR